MSKSIERRKGAAALAHGLRDRLREQLEKHGELETVSALGVSRSTLARALAGLPLYKATYFTIEQKLKALSAPSSP
jgi:hypothetical protein